MTRNRRSLPTRAHRKLSAVSARHPCRGAAGHAAVAPPAGAAGGGGGVLRALRVAVPAPGALPLAALAGAALEEGRRAEPVSGRVVSRGRLHLPRWPGQFPFAGAIGNPRLTIWGAAGYRARDPAPGLLGRARANAAIERRCWRPSVAGPAGRAAPVMQAGKHGDALPVQEFEMQSVRKPPEQDPAKPVSRWRIGLRVARQLFFGRCDHPQEIAAQAVGLLFVPVKCFGNFGLCCRFEDDLPCHRRMPSDCAICARLLP